MEMETSSVVGVDGTSSPSFHQAVSFGAIACDMSADVGLSALESRSDGDRVNWFRARTVV
jgi:hypothetical protein